MKPEILFLSIRPRHLENILKGTKTVELRKVRPRVTGGETVVLYATSPRMSVLGQAQIDSVIELPPNELWRIVGKESGITQEEFRDYFAGRMSGVALLLSDVKRLSSPVTLTTIRTSLPGFQPPQTFRYFHSDQLGLFTGS